MPSQTPKLRPASHVMSKERAGASFPTPLNFARSFARKMLREGWRMERVRLDLDAEGKGEGLYRMRTPAQDFHFFVISDFFPVEQKVDRSFGINWDASAALCQGDWSEEREKRLRPEIPKQYLGRYDRDTLCFTRGNRSERIFDEVVDALARGQQPDPATLAPVGYIFRTTAFAGNGLFGMRPYDGLGDGHPLAAPYHVQMAAAFLLREFVFDLADHLAKAKSPGAVRLDERIRRYLGIGNSAGQGLIPFIANHPHIVHRWCLAQETALAEAGARPAGGPERARFAELLSRAARYFSEDPRDGNGIFVDYARLAGELAEARRRLIGENAPAATWGEELDRLARGHCGETREALCVILLECFPDVVARHEGSFHGEERFEIDPLMTVGTLLGRIRSQYGWAVADGLQRGAFANFWYQPVEAPDEPRRGRRGVAEPYEFECKMDLVRAICTAVEALSELPGETTVAEALATRPELRHVVRRVQSVGDLDYAELRENYTSADFTPFASERFLLAFYGMEKLDPRPPRSVKGAFLQGAPVAQDLLAGRDGDWPFPLIPQIGGGGSLKQLEARGPLRQIESAERTPAAIRKFVSERHARSERTELPFYTVEYRKLMVRALLVAGLPLGLAEDLCNMGETADTIGGKGLDTLMRLLPGLIERRRRRPSLDFERNVVRIAVAPDPGVLAAPAALDLAHVAAVRSADGIGIAHIDDSSGHELLDWIALKAAQRGLCALVRWQEGDRSGGLLAIPSAGGSDLWRGDGVTRLRRQLGLEAGAARGSSISVICSAENAAKTTELRALASRLDEVEHLGHSEFVKREREIRTEGYTLTKVQFDELNAIAKRWLLPDELDPKVALRT